MMRAIFIYTILGMLALTALLWGLTFFWQGLGSGLSGHGWFAYVLGGALTLLLSVGLFLLTFFSARNGYDDVQRRDDDLF